MKDRYDCEFKPKEKETTRKARVEKERNEKTSIRKITRENDPAVPHSSAALAALRSTLRSSCCNIRKHTILM